MPAIPKGLPPFITHSKVLSMKKENNVRLEYVVFPDEGHGFVKKENEINGYGAILTFLDEYLKRSGGEKGTK